MRLYVTIRDNISRTGGTNPEEQPMPIAQMDVLASLAYVAERNHFVRPKMNEKGIIGYQGRTSSGGGTDDHQTICLFQMIHIWIIRITVIAIITGPNMAGKSTYMRQVALIVSDGAGW